MRTAQVKEQDRKFINATGIRCPKCGGNDIRVVYGWAGSYYDLECSSCGNSWTVDFDSKNKKWEVRNET
uniref:Restriction alleviation protein, Lar family n=1 Tax=Dictyoglomus turgidum TaxID=513050 RepID=A0A7C3SN55_9BACT